MRAVEESARMRSLVCCGVSRTACCARLGGAKTSIPSRADETKHHTQAPSFASCMRMDNPHVIIQGRRAKPIRDFENCDGCADGMLWAGRSAGFPRWPGEPSGKTAVRSPGYAG